MLRQKLLDQRKQLEAQITANMAMANWNKPFQTLPLPFYRSGRAMMAEYEQVL
ncbi:hypothetical protein [Spirosoma endbachense]|uniref:Uncharacterized protein n=1 Tax=Spirosoma endbachense TaxID=2666025 RepID=A0A6P1VXB6_9BACT|nr:hypothetical protein [Spirosoma endbachense]QHV96339.1 hypothetical protein GJR95_15505 [Spirosoma endbachense]